MKKRRILAVTLALVALMMCGLTSFAAAYTVTKTSDGVKGELGRWGTNGTYATTVSVSYDNKRAYVKLTEEYMSSVGNIYVSSPVIATSNSQEARATYDPTGTFMSAWSGHGHTGSSFTQYL